MHSIGPCAMGIAPIAPAQCSWTPEPEGRALLF